MKLFYQISIVPLLCLFTASLMTACTEDISAVAPAADRDSVLVTMNMMPFVGDNVTRTTVTGERFEVGDKIRFKIICPYSDTQENGETYSGYREITVPNTINASGFSSMCLEETYGANEGQATPYIYTAQNTTGTRIFVVGDYRYARPSNFFFADQSKLVQFKKSDVVWAQAVRQTGAREVHLNFYHKVAKLDITIEDSEGILSENTILTLEGMPDIDGAEIVVGDYYADESLEYSYYSYNYKTKASCGYENNGKVIGVEVIDEKTTKRSVVYGMSGNPAPAGGTYNSTVFGTIPNNATYTAYRYQTKHYLLYVPPCTLANKAEIWLRDGEKRYNVELVQTTFEEGVCYKLTVKLPSTSTN